MSGWSFDGGGYDLNSAVGVFGSAIYGDDSAPVSAYADTGGSGSFWESVTQGISSIGQLGGVALNTYGQWQNIRNGGTVNQSAPETTPDQRWVSDIQGPRGSTGFSLSPGMMLAGLALLGGIAFLALRKG